MNHRAKSPTPGLRPAFASPSQRSSVRGLGLKTASPDSASLSVEAVLTETLHTIERLIAQARARIAAHDARTRAPAPLPSLTSAFATRREIFGPVELDEQGGQV